MASGIFSKSFYLPDTLAGSGLLSLAPSVSVFLEREGGYCGPLSPKTAVCLQASDPSSDISQRLGCLSPSEPFPILEAAGSGIHSLAGVGGAASGAGSGELSQGQLVKHKYLTSTCKTI